MVARSPRDGVPRSGDRLCPRYTNAPVVGITGSNGRPPPRCTPITSLTRAGLDAVQAATIGAQLDWACWPTASHAWWVLELRQLPAGRDVG